MIPFSHPTPTVPARRAAAAPTTPSHRGLTHPGIPLLRPPATVPIATTTAPQTTTVRRLFARPVVLPASLAVPSTPAVCSTLHPASCLATNAAPTPTTPHVVPTPTANANTADTTSRHLLPTFRSPITSQQQEHTLTPYSTQSPTHNHPPCLTHTLNRENPHNIHHPIQHTTDNPCKPSPINHTRSQPHAQRHAKCGEKAPSGQGSTHLTVAHKQARKARRAWNRDVVAHLSSKGVAMVRPPVDSFGQSTDTLREWGRTWSKYCHTQPYPTPQAGLARRCMPP